MGPGVYLINERLEVDVEAVRRRRDARIDHAVPGTQRVFRTASCLCCAQQRFERGRGGLQAGAADPS
jgi:hypothetical protein